VLRRCNDAVMTGNDHDPVVPNDELTAEDRSALGWAVSTGHEVGAAVVERVRSGDPGVRAHELAAIRADWDAAGRPAPDHHIHRTSVTLIDGTAVVGVTFLADDPYSRDAAPTFGLYLDERWSPPWPHSHVDWPDFGLPAAAEAFRVALRDALERARGGERVELGCLGGHGRTGTALACLAVLAGAPASEAVAWVRADYCEKAVETAAQEAFVLAFDREQLP
jgi:hypothetical protein